MGHIQLWAVMLIMINSAEHIKFDRIIQNNETEKTLLTCLPVVLGILSTIFEHTCTVAWWAHMDCFLSVCLYYTKIHTRK